MYKDQDKAREASKERMRRYREKGRNIQGVTSEGVTGQGVTSYPLVLDPLTNPKHKKVLSYLCRNLREEDKECMWLGSYSLTQVCDLFACIS